MKIYFVIGVVVLIILISIYIFMENQNSKEPVTMSGYFKINPTLGMLGRQGLYFFEESANGEFYEVVGDQVVRINELIKDKENLKFDIKGMVKIVETKEPILGPTDEPTAEYRKVKRNVLELISYKQI